MYVVLYGNEPASLLTFSSPEEAWEDAQRRSAKYKLALGGYSVARVVPLKKVTKTVTIFEEVE